MSEGERGGAMAEAEGRQGCKVTSAIGIHCIVVAKIGLLFHMQLRLQVDGSTKGKAYISSAPNLNHDHFITVISRVFVS